MHITERTAMRVVVEQRAPLLAPATAAVAALAALTSIVMITVTSDLLYALAAAIAAAVLAIALWLTHGVRTTLDAAENTACWERTGVLRARRQARLCDVGGVVLLPSSDDAEATFSPVLTVGCKRWPLALSNVTDAEPTYAAIAEVLDLAKGRRSSGFAP